MGSRTSRFGFVTFDNETDDLSYMDYKAFVADREAMDRLLRIACEAHTHTGKQFSQIPGSAPLLELSSVGGSLPPNQPFYYKVSIVDVYGQEQVASSVAVIYTPVQVPTPDAPGLVADTYGMLPPGDYQYCLSAWAVDELQETAISPITTVSLRGTGSAVQIVRPSLPSGAEGFNVYRKGPTEAGFLRLFSVYADAEDQYLRDDGSWTRANFSAPDENTTFATSSVNIDTDVDLQPGETARIYRSYDGADWDHSFIGWTNTLPFVDVGAPSGAGYPPDVSAGVGGAPKIRMGIDTEGTLPGGRLTPTKPTMFNIRGPVQVGYWPWQWVNDYDTFWILGMRASLGRDSVPDAQPVRVALERRDAFGSYWMRYHDEFGTPLLVEIAPGNNSGELDFPASVIDPGVRLFPGDALRVAVVQNGGGAHTDHDLSIAVMAAVQHGSVDSSTWSP
jgi:hypothetical protein